MEIDGSASDLPHLLRAKQKKSIREFLDSGLSLRYLLKALASGPSRSISFSSGVPVVRSPELDVSFHWNPEDSGSASSFLALGGSYEPRETSLLRQIAAVSNLVIDVGANEGWYSALLHKAQAPSSLLVSLEPHPEAFSALVSNLALNDLPFEILTTNPQGSTCQEGLTATTCEKPERQRGGGGNRCECRPG